MRTSSPMLLLGTLGALSAASPSLAQAVDTSEWKCTACPFEKGVSGSVEVGVGNVSKQSARFSDYTGLDKGAHLIASGEVRYRSETGFFAQLRANELGLDSRSLAAALGQEGRYTLSLAYDEMPRRFADGARTPFLGNGGGLLTLPAGYPAITTAAMPLATTLQPVEIGFKRSRLASGIAGTIGDNWSYRLNARHDVRDGTRPGSGAFFSTTSQLVMPVDQVTNQLEAAASYASRRMQATLAYQVSDFRNGLDGLVWSSPFPPVGAGAGVGQLALAPDNQFHQLSASAGYQISPKMRASADLAVGRMSQDAAYLPPTQNPNLAVSVPVLPATSLRGRANTFNANLMLSANPLDNLRLNASYARNVRDNETPRAAYPAVSNDMFLGTLPRTNATYSFWQDRFKLIADYRASKALKASLGAEHDERERSYQEAVNTRETTVWGRLGAQPRENLSLSLKLAHADRRHSTYGTANWVDTVQNPLLRRYNLAERQRDSAQFRADWTASEKLTIGLGVDAHQDDYSQSSLGLTGSRSHSINGDLSYALSEETQLRIFAQGEQMRSDQLGSQNFKGPDWSARVKDRFSVVGLGGKHVAMKGKLELGADLSFSRSRSDIQVATALPSAPFPTATTALDSLKIHASYQLKDNLTLIGSYWYERYDSEDWRLDGVLPATVPYLLAFGQVSPQYTVNVVRVALRYKF